MQDGTNTTDRVADADETTIEIVSVPDEFGTIVLGNEHDIEEFAQARAGGDRAGGDRAGGDHAVDLSPGDVAPVLRAVPQLAAKVQTARYLLIPSYSGRPTDRSAERLRCITE